MIVRLNRYRWPEEEKQEIDEKELENIKINNIAL